MVATPRNPSETQETIAIVSWLRSRNVLVIHVPNEARRTAAQGAIAKKMGLSSGCPDLLIFDARDPYVGAALEVKRRAGARASALQRAWLMALAARGWACHVAYGARDGIMWLRSIGY